MKNENQKKQQKQAQNKKNGSKQSKGAVNCKWLEENSSSSFDPNGSYTGSALIGSKEPIQDADDL